MVTDGPKCDMNWSSDVSAEMLCHCSGSAIGAVWWYIVSKEMLSDTVPEAERDFASVYLNAALYNGLKVFSR